MRWTEQDRPIEDTDVVLWYTFGHTHIPRPEDYPVMPTAYIGFTLKPDGFFTANPANDVPPSPLTTGPRTAARNSKSGARGYRAAAVAAAEAGSWPVRPISRSSSGASLARTPVCQESRDCHRGFEQRSPVQLVYRLGAAVVRR